MEKITEEKYKEAKSLVQDYEKKQKDIEANEVIKKIKTLFSYPLGVECLDKLHFREWHRLEDGYKALVYLPSINQRLMLEITDELEQALNEKWSAYRPKIREPQPVEVYIKEYEEEILNYETELKDINELLKVISKQDSPTANRIKSRLEAKEYNIKDDLKRHKKELKKLKT